MKAEESNFMSILGVHGDCQLALTPTFEILCALMPSRQVIAVWPLDCLRTFAYGNGVFSFEAGRHAPHGPGEYSFITQHDHLIHGRLTKLIAKAKRNSLSSSSSRYDSRPPARLPVQDRDSSSDSHNSENDENVYLGPLRSPDQGSNVKTTFPPLPDLPPPHIPPKGSVYQEPSLQRMEQPVDSVGRFLQSNVNPPKDESGGDHVYSHTIHSKPNYSHGPSDDPQIYNSLVHDGVVKRGSGYEMAYPKHNAPITIQGSANVVYDTAYNDTDGHNKRPGLNNLPPIPGSLGDGMTANPLYGSKGNLLEDILNKQILDNNSPQSQSPPLPPKPKSMSSSPETSKLPKPSHPDVTANPVYESTGSGILGHSSPPINGQTPPFNSRSPPNNRQSLPNNRQSPPNNRHSPPNNSSLPLNNSQKDNVPEEYERKGYAIKGYSKVNKQIISDSFQDSFIPGSMESDPPPIPDRQCSFNED